MYCDECGYWDYATQKGEIEMYDIYERNIYMDFEGHGNEYIIARNDEIIGHTRGWHNPAVVSDWKSGIVGQPASEHVANGEWVKLDGVSLEYAQSWAQGVVDN